MKEVIYLVEDELKLSALLKTYLIKEGYEVKVFSNGNEAIRHIEEKPDLWVLDIMLPDTDGFSVFNEIKAADDQIPVIFMSARDSDIDRLMGLQLGSEDYIAKPFLPQELVLRCKNVLKRLKQTKVEGPIIYNAYHVYPDKRLVYENDVEVQLTTKEFDLFLMLLNHMNQSLTRDQILNKVWGIDYFGSDRVVDDLIRRLKKKCPLIKIESIYGYGYRLK